MEEKEGKFLGKGGIVADGQTGGGILKAIGCPNASELFLDFLEWVLTKHQRSLTRANVICAKNLLSFEGILKILCYV